MTADQMKIELGTELYEDFEKRKQAIYAYVTHVFAGNNPHETPDGEKWWYNLVTPVAQRIVNAYRESQGIPPNPFHPSRLVEFRAFDVLRTWEETDGWMPSSDLRKRLRNRMVDACFKKHELVKFGWMLDKRYEGTKPFFKLVRVEEGQ